MTPKDRVRLAINHEEPDKVPLDSWIAPEVADQLVAMLGVDTSADPFALAKKLGNDLLDHCLEHSLALSRELVKMGVDILWWGDDFSVERGPLMSPDLFRQLLIPRYARVIEELKSIDKNIKFAFHCDGKVEWALDDLVEIGVDIINPLQPDVNDVAAVKRRYAKKLTVWGNFLTTVIVSHVTHPL